jgi:hypothetical protein
LAVRDTMSCLSWFTSMGAVSAMLPLVAIEDREKDGAAHPPNPPYAPATVTSPLETSANRRVRNLAEGNDHVAQAAYGTELGGT